ncbi:MAG: tetratricopeptide repeat protein [Verrucomicrobiae bacterium]|nr:tetratricopeptide repeat protein [Verrucomicrobiae bacterium]
MSHELNTSFETQVLARSHELPVLVDFWAEWCGPCLMFGPILERAAASAGGRWELVKVNTEQHPDLSHRHGIRSLPTLRLFVAGESVAESLGALSEPALKQWLDLHLPSPHASTLKAAEALLESGDFARAEESAQAVLADEPSHAHALYLAAQIALAKDPSDVSSLVNRIPASSPFFEKAEPLKELSRLLVSPPDDAGKGAGTCAAALGALRRLDWDAACEAFLKLLAEDRHFGYDIAAKSLKQIFLLLGPRHPVTARHQPRFASQLFS